MCQQGREHRCWCLCCACLTDKRTRSQKTSTHLASARSRQDSSANCGLCTQRAVVTAAFATDAKDLKAKPGASTASQHFATSDTRGTGDRTSCAFSKALVVHKLDPGSRQVATSRDASVSQGTRSIRGLSTSRRCAATPHVAPYGTRASGAVHQARWVIRLIC